ncbi:hypothetical protein ABT352_33385 [Streptosporangium sp. NPDC000563]|uniref:hypothetical protein n=1 Tax=Streptosporangium sp. NPDC000563 TaxID=3154366 RepID=UPI0033237598
MTTAGLNLNAARKARAARRNRKAGPIPLYFGENEDGSDKLIAQVPSELPLHALEPFTRLDMDMAYLMHVVQGAFRAENSAMDQQEIIGMVIDLLIKSPHLPAQFVEAVRQMGREILGEDGYAAFMAERPSVFDIGDLVKGLMASWGVGQGESLPPNGGSPSGTEDSTPTSEAPTGSTSPESSPTPETLTSSESTPSSTSATISPTMPE